MRFLTFVRTNADPLPGFTCKNSRILQGLPEVRRQRQHRAGRVTTKLIVSKGAMRLWRRFTGEDYQPPRRNTHKKKGGKEICRHTSTAVVAPVSRFHTRTKVKDAKLREKLSVGGGGRGLEHQQEWILGLTHATAVELSLSSRRDAIKIDTTANVA